ncbi:hypothetical protein KAFR_0J02200 [Kazachstania africana CBS 2517]|uniref:Mitochondrial import receptor subunit TOM22 n=1 Tax=Kazachstania africana (strain ATCC 22294 / BCRC 22015 / CBS 2517 / CECT 1963 / NBRC 1671 / NRRL Y-8276) TaxID=1071382 RepID=H2B0Y4_KAZAF|nr:hypothetical protein KAFR_0J02200 [Kazachstania africana CBS 2517]CCF60284.1 hypothetical protein KAFR_0J02200 [Kazachstania africana CBS 2517]
MVQLTELKDDSPSAQDPQVIPAEPLNELEKRNVNDEEADEEDSDFEEDFNENENLMERLIALKEIVPPNKRQSVCKFFDTTSVFLKKVFNKGGSLTWALTTSALLLGVPLSLSILAEQQLIEMEKTFDLQKDANELLTSNDQK